MFFVLNFQPDSLGECRRFNLGLPIQNQRCMSIDSKAGALLTREYHSSDAEINGMKKTRLCDRAFVFLLFFSGVDYACFQGLL